MELHKLKLRWLRWFILFLFLEAVGIAALVVLQPYFFGFGLDSAPPENCETCAPEEDPELAAIEDKITSAKGAIDRALTNLDEGQVYHNVPKEMQVGVSETIEAGITPQITERIKEEIQGRGDINIESGIRFDPSGMEMRLVVQPDKFEVFEVKGGEQFVANSAPGKWIWQVTPLEAGDNLIVVKAIVKLTVPELEITRPVEVEVFRATRRVEVNPVYSARQFIASNWKEVLGLVIGSGSLASFITWWIGRMEKEKEVEKKTKPSPEQ